MNEHNILQRCGLPAREAENFHEFRETFPCLRRREGELLDVRLARFFERRTKGFASSTIKYSDNFEIMLATRDVPRDWRLFFQEQDKLFTGLG